jgi:hypothetical protein
MFKFVVALNVPTVAVTVVLPELTADARPPVPMVATLRPAELHVACADKFCVD